MGAEGNYREEGREPSREELKKEIERLEYENGFIRASYSFRELAIKEQERRREAMRYMVPNSGNRKEAHLAEVKAGKKIAYKEEASWDKVLRMRREGMTVTEIAKELGISRPTVYSRIREGEKYMELGRENIGLQVPECVQPHPSYLTDQPYRWR